MKLFFFLAALSLSLGQARSQLLIQQGAGLTITGNTLITLKDIDLQNNGIIDQTNSTFLFTGTQTNVISGTNNTGFGKLEIAKKTGALQLLQNITVANSIQFTSGLIDLNKNIILLQPAALLIDENEDSRITGAAGYVEITVPLNNPASVNPGNLGAVISTMQSPGSTTIRRSHASQTNTTTGAISIDRYYEIIPENNTGLNATLHFNYFKSELHGLAENSLELWNKPHQSKWSATGFSKKEASGHYVEQTGLATLSQATLFTAAKTAATVNTDKQKTESSKEDQSVKLYPNPVQSDFTVSLYTAAPSALTIRVMDAGAATVYSQQTALQPGANQVKVNIKTLPPAAYYLSLQWNNGASQKTVQLIKQ